MAFQVMGASRPRCAALLLTLAVAACGGKQELNFVGDNDMTPAAGGDGGNPVSPGCGNRTVDADEECDDGDRADDDGCSGDCTIEAGWTCEGAPSVCIKCGNGAVEAGEQCDDGNEDDGDGCSAACGIEGSCEAPTVIELSADQDGVIGSAASAISEGESGQVAAADCAGEASGGGGDRIFEFELPTAADLEVRVGANFDVIVRLMSSACDLADEAPGGCVDGAAVSEVETARLSSAPAGTYYVVVDGKTAQQSGDFSIDVEARCPLEGVKIQRVILSEPFRTGIVNTNQTCAVNLSRVSVYSQPEAADAPPALPAISLPPLGRRLLTSESPPPNGTTYQGNIRYDLEDYAGAFYLCRGPCDTAGGENVIDAFTWRGDSGAVSSDPPAAVIFDAAAPALTDRAKMSYFRVARDGAFPDFLAADFAGAYLVETFEDASLAGWEPPVALFYAPKFEAVTGTIGEFSLALEGGNTNEGVWNGPELRFKDHSGAAAPIEPTYVSLRLRGSDKALRHGYAFFGDSGATNAHDEAKGFGSFFRANGTIGFGSSLAPSVFQAYNVETWYQVEYKNFVYPVNVGQPGTVDVHVNGTLRGTISKVVRAVSQLSLRSVDPSTVWVDQIIVQ